MNLNYLNGKYDDFNWFVPENKGVFIAELEKELCENHKLYGLKLDVVLKNERNDDVLFTDRYRYYIVHLTWAGKRDGYPNYEIIHKDDLITCLEKSYLED